MKTFEINEVKVVIDKELNVFNSDGKELKRYKQSGNCYYVYINGKSIPLHYIDTLYHNKMKDVVPIIGFEKYGIDTCGNIWSYDMNKQMKTYINEYGYMKVYFRVNGKYKGTRIHRLVAIQFIKNPDNLGFINHKDGNKLNNHVSNLEWCTNAYNSRHQAMKNYGRIGVHLTKRNKWRAAIQCHGKRQHIGVYDTESAAKLAYNEVAIKLLPKNELLLN